MSHSIQSSIEDSDDSPLLGVSDVEELDEDNQIQKTSKSLFSYSQIPKDRFNFVYLTFNLLGIAIILPFSFFMTASDYWTYKFRNVSDVYPSENWEEKTPLQAIFQGYLALSATVPALIMFVFNTCIIKRFSQEMRNSLSLATVILFFGATLTFVKLDTDTWQIGFFELTITSVIVINGAGAVFQGGVIDLASIFPPVIVHSMVSGQGIAGVLPALAQFFTLLGDTDPITSAIIYFTAGIFILLLSFIFFIVMHRTNYFKFYMTKAQVSRELEPVLLSSFAHGMSSTFVLLWPYITSLFMTFFVTLCVYPGLATLAVSVEAQAKFPWTSRYFLPVGCFLVYSVADICGRLFSGWLPWVGDGKFTVLVLSCARLAFIPLFMLCNLHPRTMLPVIFNSDAYYIVFITVFGFSNGYCFSHAMLIGTRKAPSRLRNDASVLLSLAVGVGLLVGSVTSVGLIKLL